MDIHKKLADHCCDAVPVVAARVLEMHSDEAAAAFLESRTAGQIANLLKCTLPIAGARYLSRISPVLAADALTGMSFEDATGLLRHIETGRRDQMLSGMTKEDASAFRKVLEYPEGTLGSHMNPHVVVLLSDITLAQAIRQVRKIDKENFYFPYVVDRDQKLVGILTVRDVMQSSPRALVSDVMRNNVVSVNAYSTGYELTQLTIRTVAQSIPVTDASGALLGVLRPDTINMLIDQIKQEEIKKSYETEDRSNLADVFLDIMLEFTSLILHAGTVSTRKKEKAETGNA